MEKIGRLIRRDQLITQVFQERRPAEFVAVHAAVNAVDTIGLSLFLAWWGTNPAQDLLR